ncbi:glyoxysomal processing protease, glyoxysomal isoform X4 [Camellia sinensis]|uniref:glyoxysomal processing protease, glyoxysomal isoform X4 n=1 Tax=Camellia sinensis TaxID=4442 RepID=UPI00103592D6|nr:glyoxysomal processing protease, glyoxysomal isoform X4 [Camellia sinensis]
MGLPEIVDVARNFAVMIRVQGPDPKGLKMRKHAFHQYNSGKTTLSASGMLLPGFNVAPGAKKIECSDKPGSVVVVTVASVVEPFLSLQHRVNMSQEKPELIPGVHIEIMLEGKKGMEYNTKGSDEQVPLWLSARLLALVDVPVSSIAVESIIQASSGSLEHQWEVGWSLASYIDGPQPLMDTIQAQRHRHMVEGETSNPSFMGRSIAKIALLGVFSTNSKLVIPWEAIATACSDLLQEEPQNAYKGINYNNGNLNAVGRLCLSNSLDLNASSNHLHEHPSSGCPPSSSPIEMAMASICLVTIDDGVWASGVLLNNEGLILTNAHLLEPWRFRKATANGERNETKSEVLFTPSDDSLPSGHEEIGGDQRSQGLLPTRLKTTPSVVDDGGGYKFDWNTMHRSIRVRLDHTDPWIWCDARVVYVSKGPLDIALLQLEVVPDQLCPIVMDFTCLSPGSKVYVIGHGLFGPRCDFSPSACVGVVAKVVEARRPLPYRTSQQYNVFGNFPAMLETTAAVHPGGSGGAVVNSDGHMIGLVTSNARHGGGMTIPHLNFSIPCAALEPIFKFSRDMKDLSLLEELDKPNELLSSVWALMPPLSPKPGPPLPNLPQPLPLDINKDGKGSRFAKFMEERQEVFRKSNQLGKMKRLSTEFIPSKL